MAQLWTPCNILPQPKILDQVSTSEKDLIPLAVASSFVLPPELMHKKPEEK